MGSSKEPDDPTEWKNKYDPDLAQEVINGAHVLHYVRDPPGEVTDEHEKDMALQHIVDGVVPGRWDAKHTHPATEIEKDIVRVLRVDINLAVSYTHTHLCRHGSEMKEDIDNHVATRYWEGSIPIWETYGPPIPGPHNEIPVPEHVKTYIDDMNAKNMVYSIQVASKPWPKEPMKL
ncbi:hypothetical protein BBP40_003509 [Aspergillus hancockii]|nr:hypothetical protein BBP40_003509 [Aspergillus hancockii]